MLTRIITGLVGIAAAIGIITKGGVVFSGAVLLLSLIGWHEYHKMAASKGYHVYPLTSGLGSALIWAWLLWAIMWRWSRFLCWPSLRC